MRLTLFLDGSFDPRDLQDPFSPYFRVVWQRTGEPPPPPKLPPTRKRTFTRPGPRWQRQRWLPWGWLDTDMEGWTP